MKSAEPIDVPATPHLPIRTLLFPTDFSERAGIVLEQALYIARRHGATLHVLHVAETPTNLLDVLSSERDATLERMVGEAEAQLELLLSEHDLEGATVTSEVVQTEKAASTVIDYASEHDLSLIVMPTHGRRGLKRLFLGSTTEEIIRHAPCPVFIVRQRDPDAPLQPLRHILKPIDFSEHCCFAIPLAKELADAYEADLQVLHVVEDDPPPVDYELDTGPVRIKTEDVEKQVKQRMQQLVSGTEGPTVPTSYHVTTGNAAGAILDFAEEHTTDLIVLAARGRSGLRRFLLGSTTERVARGAACPVLVVHTEPQEAPASVD